MLPGLRRRSRSRTPKTVSRLVPFFPGIASITLLLDLTRYRRPPYSVIGGASDLTASSFLVGFSTRLDGSPSTGNASGHGQQQGHTIMSDRIRPYPVHESSPNGMGVFREQALSLAQAARRLPSVRGGKPPHPATLFRWATAGRKSRNGNVVRLEMWRVGGTNCTSLEALARFFDRLNDARPVESQRPAGETNLVLKHQAEDAVTLLRQRGLIE